MKFCQKNSVRIAVNSAEKNFQRKAPACFFVDGGESGEFVLESRCFEKFMKSFRNFYDFLAMKFLFHGILTKKKLKYMVSNLLPPEN